MDSIYLEAHNNISGVAQNFIGLLSSGNIGITTTVAGGGSIWASGQNIFLDATEQVKTKSQSTIIETHGDRIQLLANAEPDTGPFESSVFIKASNNIFLTASNLLTLTGTSATNLFCTTGSVSISSVTDDVNITASDDVSVSADDIHISITDDIRMNSGDVTFLTAQTTAIYSGLLSANLVSQNNVNISGQTGVRLFAGPTAAAQIIASGTGDIFIGTSAGNLNIDTQTGEILIRSAGNLIIESTGSTKDITVQAAGTNSDVLLKATQRIDLQNTSASGPIVLFSQSDTTFKTQTGSVIFTPRSANASATDGKAIFSNVVSNNKSPITISGVNQVEALMTGATTGDFGMQNPGVEAGPGMGRLWLNTGSGMAPVAVGSGFFLAYDNIAGSNGVSINTTATTLGFNTQLVVDRQYQHIPNVETPTSGQIIVTNAGLYEISYNAGFTYTASSVTTAVVIKCELFINGISSVTSGPSITYASTVGTTNESLGCAATTLKFLNAGDKLTLTALRANGGATRTNNGEVWIMIRRLR